LFELEFEKLKMEARVQFLETEREVVKSFFVVIPVLLVFVASREGLNCLAVGSVILLSASLAFSFWALLELKEILRSSWQVGYEAPQHKANLARMIREGTPPEEAWEKADQDIAPYIEKVAKKRRLIDRLTIITMGLFLSGLVLLLGSLLV